MSPRRRPVRSPRASEAPKGDSDRQKPTGTVSNPVPSGRVLRASSTRIPADWLDAFLVGLLEISIVDGEDHAAQALVDLVARVLPEVAVSVTYLYPDPSSSARNLGAGAGRRNAIALSPGMLPRPVTYVPTRQFPAWRHKRAFPVPSPEHAASMHLASDDAGLDGEGALAQFGHRASQALGALLVAARRHRMQRVALRSLDDMAVNLAHTEKLASLGQLAAGVVHELNNPLTAILAYADFLKRRATKEDELERLGRIHDSATRMLRVTRDLMMYARPPSEAKSQVSIEAIIDQALAFCEHVVAAANARVERTCAPQIPEIVARPQELVHVFVNLFTNACHALPPRGGRLGIVTGLTPDGGVEVRVDDNGCGIDEDSLEQIFVPFFTTKAEGKGTGLGLSIVRNIVVAHGGEIVAESQPQPSTAEPSAEDPPTVTAFILRFPRR